MTLERIDLNNVERILVLNRNHIGDCLLTTPLLRALKRGFPRAELSVSIPEENRDLLGTNPHVDELVYRPSSSRWGEKVAFALKLRKHRYDVIISLQEKSLFYGWATCGATLLSGHRTATIALDHPRTRWFYQRCSPVRGEQHEVYKYLAIASILGCPVERNPVLELEPTATAREQIERRVTQHGFDPEVRFIGINPGGTKPEKRWPAERFAQVADRLHTELGLPVVILGGADDQERASHIAARMTHTPLIVAGQTSLGDSAALLERCQLLVTGDTGPMHMAVALAVPVVALFGPTDPARYGPFTHQKAILRHPAPCASCRERRRAQAARARRRGVRDQARCPVDSSPCIHTIEVDECVDAALRLYNAPRPRPAHSEPRSQ